MLRLALRALADVALADHVGQLVVVLHVVLVNARRLQHSLARIVVLVIVLLVVLADANRGRRRERREEL